MGTKSQQKAKGTQVGLGMNSTCRKICSALVEAALLLAATLLGPIFLAIDILIFKNNVSETSLTEMTQAALLFASAVLVGISAWRRSEARGFLVLVCGLFTCMFIRELDAFFDLWFFHGFWAWLAAISAAASITCAMTNRSTVLEPMGNYIGSRSQVFILIGMIVLLVLGRIMGSGHVFWRHIMGHSYTPLFKNAIQESLELFGYILVFYGACLLFRNKESVCEDLKSERSVNLSKVTRGTRLIAKL